MMRQICTCCNEGYSITKGRFCQGKRPIFSGSIKGMGLFLPLFSLSGPGGTAQFTAEQAAAEKHHHGAVQRHPTHGEHARAEGAEGLLGLPGQRQRKDDDLFRYRP